jgi:hypothetical protein
MLRSARLQEMIDEAEAEQLALKNATSLSMAQYALQAAGEPALTIQVRAWCSACGLVSRERCVLVLFVLCALCRGSNLYQPARKPAIVAAGGHGNRPRPPLPLAGLSS